MHFVNDWDAFVQSLIANAVGVYRNSPEYTYYKHRQEDLEQLLSNSLLEDQKELVDQVLFELEARADRETEVVYRQGLRDSITILHALGVLK